MSVKERGRARRLHNLVPFQLSSALRMQSKTAPKYGPPLVRLRHQLARRKVTFVKRYTGIIPIPLADPPKEPPLRMETGNFASGVKVSASLLNSSRPQRKLSKRKIKPIKGTKVYLRAFPHLPLCMKVCCLFIRDFTSLVDTI